MMTYYIVLNCIKIIFNIFFFNVGSTKRMVVLCF